MATTQSKPSRRTVFPNDEIPHLWAHQTQEHARNSNESYWFRDRVLYSYQTPIACLATAADGSTVAILTTYRYSITTSSHQSGARSAVSHLPRLYVPFQLWRNHSPGDYREALEDHLNSLARNATEARNRVSRANRTEEWKSALTSANEYCRTFGLAEFTEPESLDKFIAELDAELKRRAEEQQKRAERERKKREREAKRNLTRWLAGEDVGRLYGLATQYMRVSRDGNDIETTLGARVPLDHIRRAAPAVLGIIKAGRTYDGWQSESRPIRLGHYTLDSIQEDGTVSVGCHKFTRAEIERVAGILESLPVES